MEESWEEFCTEQINAIQDEWDTFNKMNKVVRYWDNLKTKKGRAILITFLNQLTEKQWSRILTVES